MTAKRPGNTQETSREGAGETSKNTRGKSRNCAGTIQKRMFRKHPGNVLGMFRDYPGNIQGKSRELSGNVPGISR